MSTYPMRVSPDGEMVAIRRYPDSDYPWETVGGPDRTDQSVKDWTPLVPQPPRWKAEQLALDEYSMLWEHARGTKGDHMKALKHVVGVLLYGDGIALDPRDPELALRQWGVWGTEMVSLPLDSIDALKFTLQMINNPTSFPVIRTRPDAKSSWEPWRKLRPVEARELRNAK